MAHQFGIGETQHTPTPKSDKPKLQTTNQTVFQPESLKQAASFVVQLEQSHRQGFLSEGGTPQCRIQRFSAAMYARIFWLVAEV